MLSFSKKFPASLRSRASRMHANAVAGARVSQMANALAGARASIAHDNAIFSSYAEKASLIVIERLASDPRMDAVWTELTKRVRSGNQPTAKYFHPARPRKPLAIDPQPIALEELFCWIVPKVVCSRFLAPADDVPVADLLLQEADRLRGAGSRKMGINANQLSKAATILASIEKPDPARQVVIELATYLEERFGNAMYGATSIIASVALDQKITKKMVRTWCSRSVTKSGQNDQNRAYS
jgi:hypothetical protein